jgi:SAM-dependent methyltransferase
MNPAEYVRLAQVDQHHWFYRGKRHIVRHWIGAYTRLGGNDLLIDGGTGTGIWPQEMARQCRVLGIDEYEESLTLARPRLAAVGGEVLKSGLQHVPLPDGLASVVTLLDVLEHLDDAEGAFREMLRLTKPGGLLVVTVPALMWLWSDWDVALHHRRRYTKKTLRQTLNQPGAEILRCAYFNTFALPAVALVRAYRRWRPAPGSNGVRPARMEDRIPGPLLNRMLFWLMTWPACRAWCAAPLGVSLLAVVRKR